MIIIDPKIEYLIVVPGKARSFRSRYAKVYREKVCKAAKKVVTAVFHNDDIDLKLDYFHRGNRNVDMDNIAKNVMDALIGVAYSDDKLVKAQKSKAHKIDEIVRVGREVFDIFKPLVDHREYLVIRVSSKDAYAERLGAVHNIDPRGLTPSTILRFDKLKETAVTGKFSRHLTGLKYRGIK